MRIYTDQDIMNHLNEVGLYNVPDELADTVSKYPRWILVEVNVCHVHSKEQSITLPMKGLKYSETKALNFSQVKTPFPTVVLLLKGHGYEAIDGSHRCRAAFMRGDKTILAYVPYRE